MDALHHSLSLHVAKSIVNFLNGEYEEIRNMLTSSHHCYRCDYYCLICLIPCDYIVESDFCRNCNGFNGCGRTFCRGPPRNMTPCHICNVLICDSPKCYFKNEETDRVYCLKHTIICQSCNMNTPSDMSSKCYDCGITTCKYPSCVQLCQKKTHILCQPCLENEFHNC